MIKRYKDLEIGDLVQLENAKTYDGSIHTGEGRVYGFAMTTDGRITVWVDIGEGNRKPFMYENIKKVAPHGDVSHVAD